MNCEKCLINDIKVNNNTGPGQVLYIRSVKGAKFSYLNFYNCKALGSSA